MNWISYKLSARPEVVEETGDRSTFPPYGSSKLVNSKQFINGTRKQKLYTVWRNTDKERINKNDRIYFKDHPNNNDQFFTLTANNIRSQLKNVTKNPKVNRTVHKWRLTETGKFGSDFVSISLIHESIQNNLKNYRN